MAQPRTSFISHVAQKGQEIIELMVHTGANLPIVDNLMPNSYVTRF